MITIMIPIVTDIDPLQIISPRFDEEINKLDWKPRQLPSLTLNN